jgi:hypothetical protein
MIPFDEWHDLNEKKLEIDFIKSLAPEDQPLDDDYEKIFQSWRYDEYCHTMYDCYVMEQYAAEVELFNEYAKQERWCV